MVPFVSSHEMYNRSTCYKDISTNTMEQMQRHEQDTTHCTKLLHSCHESEQCLCWTMPQNPAVQLHGTLVAGMINMNSEMWCCTADHLVEVTVTWQNKVNRKCNHVTQTESRYTISSSTYLRRTICLEFQPNQSLNLWSVNPNQLFTAWCLIGLFKY